MDPWTISLLLKPFFLLLLFGGIALPIRYLLHKHMKEGPLKTFLLKHRFGDHKDRFMRH